MGSPYQPRPIALAVNLALSTLASYPYKVTSDVEARQWSKTSKCHMSLVWTHRLSLCPPRCWISCCTRFTAKNVPEAHL